jgi:pyruvate dehydrogenase E1 component alpha subunit
MFCELLGKVAGYCGGKGGSMHIADQDTGNLGANAIVGGSAGIATGAAFASKRMGLGRVVVCFFGEGALNQGVVYESMNMAQLWKLPVVFVCENNLYNEYTHHSQSTAGSMMARPEALGMLTAEVNGQDVREVYATALHLVERARRNAITPTPLSHGEGGPAFMLCHTYRYHGHHVGDVNRAYYRSKEEEAAWKAERDPLRLLRDGLESEGRADQAIFEGIELDVRAEVEAAAKFALESPFPAPEEVNKHVYVE